MYMIMWCKIQQVKKLKTDADIFRLTPSTLVEMIGQRSFLYLHRDIGSMCVYFILYHIFYLSFIIRIIDLKLNFVTFMFSISDK